MDGDDMKEDERLTSDAETEVRPDEAQPSPGSAKWAQLKAAKSPTCYDVTFPQAPIGLTFARRRQRLVVTGTGPSGTPGAEVIVGSSIECVNGADATLLPYE